MTPVQNLHQQTHSSLSIQEPHIGVVECLAMMEQLAEQRHNLFAEIGAHQASLAGLAEPLPQWACEVLQKYEHGAHRQYIAFFTIVRTALEAMVGFTSDMVYEIWTVGGLRLDGQFLFAEHARGALATLGAKFPDAFIMCINADAPRLALAQRDNPALLDTLIGDVRYLSTRPNPSQGEPLHAVQDATGRTLVVSAAELMGHAAFDRLSAAGRAAVAAVRS